MLTPSPIRSPSVSSTTSPRWTPTRNSMRRSGGRPALRSSMPFCTSMAQRTASTTLLNSMMLPSPVRFTTRPLWTLMVGAIRSLQSVRSRASVPSSSLPVRRLKPTTSAARMAASFRFSVTGGVIPAFAVAEEAYCTPRGVAKSPRAVRPQQDVLSSHVGDLGFSICHVRCAFAVGHSLAIIL